MRKLIGRIIEWFLAYTHVVKFEATSCYSNLPKHQYSGDAGYDMFCSKETVVPPLGYADIPVNLRFQLPKGVYVLIKGRSSSLKSKGLIVTDSVIDNGYRGEMFSCVYNTKDHEVVVRYNERVSQIVPFRLIPLKFVGAGRLDDSIRGHKGFGSSGE